MDRRRPLRCVGVSAPGLGWVNIPAPVFFCDAGGADYSPRIPLCQTLPENIDMTRQPRSLLRPILAGMSQTLHLLRAGQYQDHAGQAVTLSERDLGQIAAGYSPDVHEAPIVIGHPQTDAPAWGWIKSITADDSGLHAEAGQLNPEFAEAVRTGRYKKISVALYGPAHPNNPTDDWYLRHVGFLGAQPPVVKGLAQAQLSEAEDPPTLTTEIALGEADVRPWVFGSIARLMRGLREWVIDKHTLDDADRILPAHDIETVAREEERLIEQSQAASLAEPEKPKPTVHTVEDKKMSNHATDKPACDIGTALAEREAALAEREAKLQAAEEQAAAAAQRQAETEAAQFAERLAGEGRILPRHQAGLARILTLLPAEASAEFAEAAGQQAQPAVFLRDFLAALPPQVQFGEAAPATSQPPTAAGHFSAPASVQVRPERLALHDQAVALSEADASLSYIEAVSRLQRQSQEAQP